MVFGIEGGGNVVAIFENDEHLVVAKELTEREAASVVVEAEHVGVKPHFASAECRSAVLLERDAVYFILGDEISARLLALDGELREIHIELQHLQAEFRLEGNLQHFSLAIGVGCEPENLRAGLALREVVFLVAGQACYGEALHIYYAALAVLIEDIVDGAGIVALKHV